MDLNANDKLLLKQIVTQLARSVRDIQLRLCRQGITTHHGIWLIGDLKHTIKVDILKNPELRGLIDKVKTGENPLENLVSTEKYAKSLSDMSTPASEKEVIVTNTEEEPKPPRRRRRKAKADEVEEHWGKAEPEDWAYRYRWVYDALYKQLPKWKMDVVDAKPEQGDWGDRITNELAKKVLETAQDFALYCALVKTLPDESKTKSKLTEQLLSTHYTPK